MRNSSVIGRIAAVAAVVIAVVVVAAILLSSGSSYKVKAIFENASQIVPGDLVEVSGNSIGTVSDITLTPNGQAQLTLNITGGAYRPLREGTQATVREASLSGIANRYIDLRLGPASGAAIKDGGVIPTTNTTSAVDLDQLLGTLNGPTRKALQDVIQGSASQWAKHAKDANAAFEYLNPAIASSSVLFREINRDTGKFTDFIVKSGNLVSDIAQRQADLSGLIHNLATTTEALASQRTALAQSITQLPPFMRLANTTFVNLRRALDDLTPLVDASKPVAPKLQKLLVQLRPPGGPVGANGPRPREHRPASERRQRSHRAHRPRPATRRGDGPYDQRQRQAATRGVPPVDGRAQSLNAGARVCAAVRCRPHRLV
jgi:phospholipid/cholesterol/gamma-HCH transport system substrate-binding protein